MSAAASTVPAQSMRIAKVKEHIGAIVTGIDLAQPIDPATKKELYDAVVDNVVLVIRGQAHLTPAQLQAAGEMFGELMEDQNRRYLVDGFPLISVLDNRNKDSKGQPAKVGANATWHTDHTNQELPPKFTMLYAVAVPDKGGATSVCNARAAYEALPADVKLKIAGARTEIEQVIGRADNFAVVLDQNERVAEVAQVLQSGEKPAVVARMQSDCRLVQHVQYARQTAADLAGQADSLRFAARQGWGRPRERQIIEADVDEELQTIAHFAE